MMIHRKYLLPLIVVLIFASIGCGNSDRVSGNKLISVLPEEFNKYSRVSAEATGESTAVGRYWLSDKEGGREPGEGGEVRITVYDNGVDGKGWAWSKHGEPFEYRGLQCYPAGKAEDGDYQVTIPVAERVLVTILFKGIDSPDTESVMDTIEWDILTGLISAAQTNEE